MAQVIVVGSQADVISTVESALKTNQHSLMVYRKGGQALDAVQSESADLIVLDVEFGDMDGFDIAYKIRQDILLRDVPLLLLASPQTIASRGNDLKVADDYIETPPDSAKLLARVEAMLRRHSMAQNQTSLDGRLRGRLELVGGANAVVQMVAMLNLEGGLVFDDRTVLYFSGGRLVHVLPAEKADRTSILRIMNRKEGFFRFDPQVTASEKSMNSDPMSLLLEASKLEDEVENDSNEGSLDPDSGNYQVVEGLSEALDVVEGMGAVEVIQVSEKQDKKHGDTCLLFQNDNLNLVALHSVASDISENLRSMLKLEVVSN
ncbi:MAG: response regulator [Deinococcota bacterium]